MKREILSSQDYEEYFDQVSLLSLIKDCEIDLGLEHWEDTGNLELRIKRVLGDYYYHSDPSGETSFALEMEAQWIEAHKALLKYEDYYHICEDKLPNNLGERLDLVMAFARQEILALGESLNPHLQEIGQPTNDDKDLSLKDKLEFILSKYREKAIEHLFSNEIEAHEKSLGLWNTNYSLYVRFTKVISEYKRIQQRSVASLNQAKQEMLLLIDAINLIVSNGITGTHKEKEAQLQGLKAILEAQRNKINWISQDEF